MKPVHIKGILAGIAGGLAVSAVLMLHTWLYEATKPIMSPDNGAISFGPGIFSPYPNAFTMLCLGLYGVILLLTGAVAAWLAREPLHDPSNALKQAAFSGALASLMWVACNAQITVALLQFFYIGLVRPDVSESLLGVAGQFIVVNIGCYSAAFLFVGTALALIGGGLCSKFILNNTSNLQASGAT
ncbi:hypothetical protein [Methanocella arvoryzae]|uniref:Uncharacterized protein n=1 Tax=Methanocella arvoryzae (strain DSM 22066 / NBRC 105507 / MRE50) TaxID=351160 RepID=Q0W4W6_METAR|nr:hypothetical protein [Methanocella arvoryzae]CAJ36577.1 hypothetical protein RCIX1282 [Methanocella arvoryzae MRE50]